MNNAKYLLRNLFLQGKEVEYEREFDRVRYFGKIVNVWDDDVVNVKTENGWEIFEPSQVFFSLPRQSLVEVYKVIDQLGNLLYGED